MGKKEASKGREWEKGRRDVLNQTFLELHKALPNYAEGQIVSKKTILIQALACIRQLQQGQKGENNTEGDECLKADTVQKWVHHILNKFYQLLSLAHSTNIEVPTEFLSLEAPPGWVNSDVSNLLTKINKYDSEDVSEENRNNINKKPKVVKKKKTGSPGEIVPSSNISVQNICPQNSVNLPGGKQTLCHNVKSDVNSSVVTNPSVIQSNPLVVQSSLQMPSQLLFTSSTPTSPLSSSLPLLVSVTGVKTVNPFILVQSNVLTPNLPAVQKAGRGGDRPIQPGPPNKGIRKLKKVAIPALKQKSILSNVMSSEDGQKTIKRTSDRHVLQVSSKGKDTIERKKISKVMQVPKPACSRSAKHITTDKLNVSGKAPENSSLVGAEKQPVLQGTGIPNVKATGDVDKENVDERNITSKIKCNLSEGNTFVSTTSKDEAVPDESASKSTISEEVKEQILPDQTCGVGDQQKNDERIIKRSLVPVESNSVKKRLCEVDINTEGVKRIKCETRKCPEAGQKSSDETINNLSSGSLESSPMKMAKSNYSISALCERQQLMQSTAATTQASEAMTEENSSSNVTSKSAVLVGTTVTSIADVMPAEKSNEDCCTHGKGKEAFSSSADSYPEWSDKSKCKTDRICSSFNIFSSLPLHNSKNTFIPISDMDSFKSVPESFDSTDVSFGLPLPSSDISNDIFASLQVPTGGQHPESISPTAAFLLAFPLVSTSKATELLSEEGVCENNDSQPGMKTILQIGNLDCDTPVTKCVSEFSSTENSIVYSTPSSSVFSQNTSSATIARNKTVEPAINVGNFIHKDRDRSSPLKSNNITILAVKENSNFIQETPGSPSKVSQPFLTKPSYQQSCVKGDGQPRNESGPNHSNAENSILSLPNKTAAELEESEVNKNTLKVNHEQESTPFLVCEKQTDWAEMPHTSHIAFTDFPTSSASRSDCAVHFSLPSVLMSSSSITEDMIPASAKSQALSSSSGILSWSTLSAADNNSSKLVPKPSHFEDIFLVSKVSTKAVESQQLIPSHGVTASAPAEPQLVSISSSANPVVHKLNAAPQHYNQTHHIASSSQELLLSAKQTGTSNNFSSASSHSGSKKSFSSSVGTKLGECRSSEMVKGSSDLSGSSLFTHQQLNHIQGSASASSASIMYSSSQPKQAKVHNHFYDERTSSQNIKSEMSSSVDSQNPKPTSNQFNYGQNTHGPEAKQSPIISYSHISNLNVKESLVQDHMMMNSYQHQISNASKQQVTITSQYPVGISSTPQSKKNMSQFEPTSGTVMEISKQNVSGLNFNADNHSNMMVNFSSSSVGSLAVSQEQYNGKVSGLEGQQAKTLSSQQRHQCGRSNSNKESVTNLHRPPVNWMTAPDIRSHQHHSGPSFGNSSNMSSTQGVLYLSEHTKDTENTSSVFDQSSSLHCLDLPHTGQPMYKGNEIHLFGNENVENFHDNSAWSPSKNGGSSMLGNIMIPSTLPTLVGDLALGDNNISRPFLPSYSNDTPLCPKKSARRTLHTSRRAEKITEENSVTTVTGQECVGSFLSVSQLVDSGSGSKNRSGSKETSVQFMGSYHDHDLGTCQSSKQSSSKPASSNYSTEALLSSSNVPQMNQLNNRKRRSHSGHYPNAYVGGSMSYQNGTSAALQGTQAQFIPELPRGNDFQGTFLHSDAVPSFMLSNPSRTHRNHSYPLQNISDRSSVEDTSSSQRPHQSSVTADISGGRHRTTNNITVNNVPPTSSATLPSSNIMDFGYMNMPSTVLQDDISFTNPPPHPSFLTHHHSYPMPAAQDTLYSTSRLPMHPSHGPQNGNVQSPSATTLTNFHLSTIFPEINEKVIC